MLHEKTGLPNESDIVMCTVTKIHYHSVFVRLNEFNNLSGMIHISEISPGRIRNLNDYVKEGKVIVCKVLKVNQERRQIDLSLRRVSEHHRRAKVDGIKQETIAEKIIEYVAKKHKIELKDLYGQLIAKIFEDYDSVYDFFEDYVAGEAKLTDYAPKEFVKDLDEIIKQRIKKPEVTIKGEFELKSYDSHGLDIIKKALQSALEVDNERTAITYLGAGRYKIIITTDTYQQAESILEKATKKVQKAMKKDEYNFKRSE